MAPAPTQVSRPAQWRQRRHAWGRRSSASLWLKLLGASAFSATYIGVPCFAMVPRVARQARGAASPASPSMKIYYGDMAFWRAECVRLCLYIGDIPFEDVRDQKRVDLKAAGKLTFGAVPVLEVDGKILSQTQAMASYVGRLTGMVPTDPWLAAKVDEAINGCTDVTTTIGSTFRLPDEEKVPTREALIKPGGRLHMHLSGLEALLQQNGCCGCVAGKSITVADLAVWRLVGWLGSGVLDGIPKDFVRSTFPELAKLCDAVEAHPKVQEWTEMTYPKAGYASKVYAKL